MQLTDEGLSITLSLMLFKPVSKTVGVVKKNKKSTKPIALKHMQVHFDKMLYIYIHMYVSTYKWKLCTSLY